MKFLLLILNLTTFDVTTAPFQTLEACVFASNQLNRQAGEAISAWCTATSGKNFPGQPSGIRP